MLFTLTTEFLPLDEVSMTKKPRECGISRLRELWCTADSAWTQGWEWQGEDPGAGAAGIGALICSASVFLILQRYRNCL